MVGASLNNLVRVKIKVTIELNLEEGSDGKLDCFGFGNVLHKVLFQEFADCLGAATNGVGLLRIEESRYFDIYLPGRIDSGGISLVETRGLIGIKSNNQG